MLIDTHCHLDAGEFDADRDRIVDGARAAGVAMIVVPAIGAVNFAAVRTLAHRHDNCCYALGIHPMYVDRSADEDLERLRDEVERSMPDPRFVGIGEIGLDHFVPGLDRDRQERFLEFQLKLAREFELPVILHVRRAQDPVLKHLRRHRPLTGIAHAFNGSLQQAAMFVELGFALGFGGAFTFTRARQIRRLLQQLPAHAHVLETDSPDIPPAWLMPARDAPPRNTPAEVAGIARSFAELRQCGLEQALQATGENACRVLPRMGRLLQPDMRPRA